MPQPEPTGFRVRHNRAYSPRFSSSWMIHMNTLLFYKKPVPLNRETHRHTRFKPLAEGFRFAAKNTAVPVGLIEFPKVAIEYPIVFLMNENGDGSPAALTGVRNDENLFVGADGDWNGEYVPAFVRRYPFALYEQPNGEDMLVMIDEEAPGFNAEDGQPLFDDEGKEGQLLTQALQFIEFFKNEGPLTRAFVAMLKKHDLLVPRSIDIQMPGDVKMSMNGFFVVEEERLAKLSDEVLLELVRSGDFSRIQAHLLSLNNVSKLLHRLEPRMAQTA
jgi:hypothetical protein